MNVSFGERARWGCALLALAACRLHGQNVITTLAGIDPVFNGNGQPAVNVPLGYVNGVATDSAGNVYFTDPLEHLILRVATDGTLAVIAGNGIAAYSGDGGPATSAGIAAADSPEQYAGALFEDALGGIAVDPQGNVFFADGHRIRRVAAADGTITTVAGGGTQVSGDGGPATSASLGIVNGLALDSAGNLYFSERNLVRKMTPGGMLSTYAGTGFNGFSGDGGAATAADLSQPLGLAIDAQGNLYVADGDVINVPSRVRKISASGLITTVAGGGTVVPSDGANPLNLSLHGASGLAVDASGAVYVYAPNSGYLLKITGNTTALITSPVPNNFIDNVPARSAYLVGLRLYDNSGLALDPAGNLYVAESRDGRLCKIDAHGFLTTAAGSGSYGYGGDGGPALGALIQGPAAMTQVPNGTIYFVDALNGRVRMISPAGIISTVLKSIDLPGLPVFDGIASDPSGNVYVLLGHRLLELTPSGKLQFIVNEPNIIADGGDGGPAAQATLQSTGGLTRDAAGNLYLSDPMSHRIREVTLDGKIHTVAGTGMPGTAPDGAVAANSPLSYPTSLLADGQGGLYFEDSPPPPTPLRTAVLRYITPDGHLKTIAGNGNPNSVFSGDGGPATQAGLALLRAGMALDKAGNLYFSDSFHYRVRVIAPNGIINTFAGNGTPASAGDGGPPSQASLIVPSGLLFDAQGDLLISDVAGNRIRAVLAAPPPISVSATRLSFSAKAGGARTPPEQLTITSPVSGLAFSITKSESADWLIVGLTGNLAAGYTPRLVSLRADPSKLTPGDYQATLTITAPLATPVSTAVTVTMHVTAGSQAELAVDKNGLSFTFPSQPTTSRTQVLRVFNVGTGTLAFTAHASGGNWLSANPASGSATPNAPGNVSVRANPTGLAAGTYTGTVTIASSASGESVQVLVALTVSTLDQAIQLSHAALSFTAVAGGGVVPPRSFAITNLGRGTMNVAVSTRTLSGGSHWLVANPSESATTAGSAPAVIFVRVNPDGLAPGFYYGLVRVDAAGSANTPQVVTVVLRVLPQGDDPGPVIEPSDIVITAEEGAPPGSVNLFVYNVSATPQTYVSSVIASDPNDQFQFVPENSTLTLTQPTRLVVQPLTSGLAAGVYEAELTLQFSDGSIRRAGIRTVVKPAATAAAREAGAEPHDATGCTSTQLVPAITTLGQSFNVPAAWPVALEADVRDDCGNTLDSGSVTVSFSNGDPPLDLLSVQEGGWQATWVSGHTAGPVTLTLTASDPARNLTGTRLVTGGLGNSSQSPVLSGAVSAASYAANRPLAPGSIIALFGQDLANGSAPGGSPPLGTTLAGATVVIAGRALPLLYASGQQVNGVVPLGVGANTSQQIVVQRGNTLSVPVSVDVAAAEPAVFPYPAPGDPPAQGAIVNAVTYAVAQPTTPVSAGDVLAIFCTGLGVVDKPVADGAAAPGSPPANTVAKPAVTIGGKAAKVIFSGLAPGYVGLYQIDAAVPDGISASNQMPVVISIAGQTGPAVTIAVK